MSEHTESSLKALTVPKLKELLAKHSLSQAGKKDELIARILASSEAIASDSPAAAPISNPKNADGAKIASVSTTKVALDPLVQPSGKDESIPAPQALPAPTSDELAAAAAREKERRESRAARFGIVADPAVDEALLKRADRFGLSKETNGQDSVVKSLAAIDRPLGVKPARSVNGPKAVLADASTQQSTKGKPVAPETPTDPEILKKLAEEEEKKKKRAARFGGSASTEDSNSLKKAKVDA